MRPDEPDKERYYRYYGEITDWMWLDDIGVLRERTQSFRHINRMIYPLANAESVEEILDYPLPRYSQKNNLHLSEEIRKIKESGYAAVTQLHSVIWELCWHVRSMENLMMYMRWIWPRIKKLIKRAKEIHPEVIVIYHSCGYMEPLIPYLIEAGVDVLNPNQSECMDFEEIHRKYGDKLSFHGTIGTQTTMPVGTPEEVKMEVRRNLEIAGSSGGLLVAPTHLLEPEVPWENIEAYVEACRGFL